MALRRRHKADGAVTMLIVVPVDKRADPLPGTPCIRLVVASKFYINLGGSNDITLYRSIYRAGINQGIFARRQDNQVGRGRVERQLAYGKKLDEK